MLYGKPFDSIQFNFPQVDIISPKNGDSVYLSSGLTIRGTSSDTRDTNCTILTSINNIQPFQTASAIGPQEEQDFSNWTSTFINTTNMLRLGKNTIISLIVCLNATSNTPTSSSNLINLTGLPSTEGNQSTFSSVSRVIHDGLESRIFEQHTSSDQSTPHLQGDLPLRLVHRNDDKSQSQHQSTLSPNSGQSTTGNH